MKKVKIAVIGIGWFGEIHCDAISAIPSFELAALCTRTESRLAEMGEKYGVFQLYTDYNELLTNSDIDAVSIVTMWDQHTAPAIAALEAGKHVFLEKPMAHTVADCQAICGAATKAPGHLMVGHICRFNPRYAAAKEQIASGAIGKVLSMSSR
ncbi:MAG: Gfo/Idh/MocA family protein, partial [Rhizobiaceae bacterium]